MKLKTKFTIISVIVISLALIVGVFVFIQVQELESQIEENRIAGEIMKGVFELNLLTSDYLLHPGERNQEQWQSRHQSIEEFLQPDVFGHYLERHLEEQIILDSLRQDHEAIQTTFLRLTESLENQEVSPELEERLVAELLVKSQTMLSGASRLMEVSRTELAATQQKTVLFVMISVVILVGAILSALLVQARNILGPILSLQKGAEIIGTGNLKHRIEIERKDEIGILAQAFNKMVENLSKEITEHERTEGTLQERVKELNVIYETSKIMEKSTDLNKALNKVVKIIPPAYRFPKLACAKIIYNGKEYKTENFKKTKWKQSVLIKIAGKKTGIVEVFYFKKKPFLVEEEKMIKEVAAQVGNITERKKVEAEVEAEKEKLKTYIESMVDGVVITDAKGAIVQANKSYAEMLSYKSVEELIGNLAFEIIAKKDRSRMMKMFMEAMKKKTHVFKGVELTYLKKDGKEIPVMISVRNVWDKKGKLVYAISVVRDITEQKKAEKALREAEIEKARAKEAEAVVGELKKLDKMKDEFLDIASHELRTPLTAIRGNISLMKEHFSEKLKDEKLKEIISDVHESSVRLIGLINDFLDVSRLEGGRIEFKKEKFDLSRLTQEVMDELGSSASEKGLYLRIEKIKGYLPSVLADKDRTRQAITNLLGNAIKFTEKGGVTVKIERGDGFVKANVSDTGIGIPKQNQKLLFQKFQQAGERVLARDVSRGTGLGLYISKMLVEGMGGKIYLVRTEIGKGSTFRFELPIADKKREPKS